MRHDRAPSSVMYAPVMSQCSTTILGSCGLMVGAIIVPPPPGPTMVQGSKRGAGPGSAAARAMAGSIHARTVVRFIGVHYLSAECLTVLRSEEHTSELQS